MPEATLRLLCVSASPNGSAHLKVDREVKAICEAFQSALVAVDLKTRGALSLADLHRALLDVKPDVLHFSGHGRPDGLLFETADGEPSMSHAAGLGRLLGTLAHRPKLVFLNACDSLTAAQAVAPHVTCAVGWTEPVGSTGATLFADGFYGALARGLAFKAAAEAGCALLAAQGVEGADDVGLVPGPGVDLSTARLLADPIAAYRASLQRDHGHLTTVLGHKLDPDRYVELDLTRDRRDPGEARDWHGPRRLDAVLAEPGARLIVLGDAGAGKSTLARHTAYAHAQRDALPVYLSLPTLTERLAEDWPALVGDAVLAAALTQRRTTAAPTWLLLDGLDELKAEARPAALQAINRWANTRAPGLRVAVFSRPAGYEPAQLPGLRAVRVRPLEPGQQQALLRKWLAPADHTPLWKDIQAQPGLRDLAPNPLLLSLLALTWRNLGPDACLPRGRVGLYGEALRVLLEQPHRPAAERLTAPDSAREVLQHLSFALQQSGEEAWPLRDLRRALRDLEADRATGDLAVAHRFAAQPGAVKAAREEVASGSEGFLHAVRARTHILRLVDKGGAGTEHWQFFHRALRDALAAELLVELHRHDAPAMEAVCAAIGADGTGRWGETLALAAAAVSDPVTLIRALAQRDADLGRRLVLEADDLPAEAAAALAKDLGDDPEVLRRLVEKWPQLAPSLWRRVTPDAKLDTMAGLHYALSAAEWVDDVRFFGPAHADRPLQPLTLKFVDLPAGTFQMGSPEGVGDDDERPQHPVTLSAFAMSATVVTNADLARLAREADGLKVHGGPTHPASDVSWYLARLFTRWAGQGQPGSLGLPSEAQWEYACRAGSPHRWHHGDDEVGLAEYAWYSEGSIGNSHPVAEKKPNAWGLYDLHGNVLEWCHDWSDDYPAAPSTDPLGPPSGARRVLRGGGYWSDAGHCRSAYRLRDPPGLPDHVLGFRLVRPAPDAGPGP